MKKLSFFTLFIGTMLMYQNCGKPSSLDYSSSIDLATEAGLQKASLGILEKNCSECHNSTTQNGNVGDVSNVDYLIYSRLVVPGEPEISPIIVAITQGAMPVGKPPLGSSDVEILKSWILALNQDTQGTGGTPTPTILEPKYSALAQQIFTPLCVQCHAGKNYKLNSYAEVLRTVKAGDAANSLLYQAVTIGATGGKMPQGGGLSSTQIKAIQDWINAGAQNN